MPSAVDADACSTGFFVNGRAAIPEQAEWQLPEMIAVSAGKRQDETELETIGQIDWVDEETDAFRGVSQPDQGGD